MSAVMELAPVADFERFLRDRTAAGTDELAAVSAALDRAAGGRATRLAICGTTGSGRTRLIEHARGDATRVAMRVLATHGRAGDADIPYASMLTLLHPVADRIEDLPAEERASLGAALDLRAADVDERAARTGLWRLLTRLGEERPLLITVDDSHLMDSASAEVLAFALGRLDSQPVAALAAADCRRAKNPLVAIGDDVIVLEELDVDAVVRAVRASVPATDHVIRRMAAFAGGDRDVAVELVQALTPDQRAGRAVCPLVPTPPTAVEHALEPIVDDFDTPRLAALALVAADTSEDVEVVRAAQHQLGLVGDPLAALEHDGQVVVTGTAVRPARPMIEVVAYHRLDTAVRRAVHGALAAVMTAPHLEAGRAWQLAEAADGRTTDTSAAMASVARTAAQGGDFRQAAVAHERAAELAEGHAERAASISTALGLWTALADPAAMRRLLAAPGDDVATRITRSAAIRWLEGDGAAVPELRAAAPRASLLERSMLDALFADAALACGRTREAMETARQVVRRDGPVVARHLAAALLALGGELPVERLGPLEDAPSGDVGAVVHGRAALRHAEALLLSGDVDAAEQVLGAADPSGAEAWDPAERAAVLARLTIARGHPASAQQLADAVLERLPAAAELPRAIIRLARAEAQFLLGDGEAAMEVLDEIAPIFHRAGMTRAEASTHGMVGRIAWSVGQMDVAVACLERARRIDPCAPVGDLVALLASLGRDQDARAWLARIDRRPGEAAAAIDVLRARANVATEAGEFEAVAAHLRQRHLVVTEAELMIDLAAWHHRRGRWADVYRAAEQAARLLIPSAIKAWIDRLDRLEPPAHAGTGDVPDVLIPLTDAERRVAMAVSRGISNREVAGELFVSIKTVDSHLQRIYPKLGIRSRAELAALVNGALAGRSGTALGLPTGNLPDVGR
jgi:DNA-binding CsgD family transcriptional regulator/tetratricopeptide (TPR) repeat protein